MTTTPRRAGPGRSAAPRPSRSPRPSTSGSLELLRSLGPDDWAKPTDCPVWDVRAMAGHVRRDDGDVRRRSASSSTQMRAGDEGGRRRRRSIDGMTAVQVARAAPTSRTDELIDRGRRRSGPRAARWRAECPALFRRHADEGGGRRRSPRRGASATCSTSSSPATRGCTGSTSPGPPAARWCSPPEHDGRIVADVVAEWARRHGQPFTLHARPAPPAATFTARRRRRGDHPRRRRVLPHPLGPGHRHRPAHPGGSVLMETRVTEVADGIHQLTTYVAEADFSFNQYLITGDEPLLFHTGAAPAVPARVARPSSKVVPVESLRWITLRPRRVRRVRLDERLARRRAAGHRGPERDRLHGVDQRPRRPAAPPARRRRGARHRRPPRALDRHAARAPRLGGRRALRRDDRARCSAATSSPGTGAYAAASDDDIVGPGGRRRGRLRRARRWHPTSGATIRRLAELDVDTLALMHGPAFTGDCRKALLEPGRRLRAPHRRRCLTGSGPGRG